MVEHIITCDLFRIRCRDSWRKGGEGDDDEFQEHWLIRTSVPYFNTSVLFTLIGLAAVDKPPYHSTVVG